MGAGLVLLSQKAARRLVPVMPCIFHVIFDSLGLVTLGAVIRKVPAIGLPTAEAGPFRSHKMPRWTWSMLTLFFMDINSTIYFLIIKVSAGKWYLANIFR